MNWTIDGIRIFTQAIKEDVAQIIPRLQPLDGGTILQIFGYESDIRTLSCIVVGNTDKDAIKALTENAGTVVVQSPEGSLGSYYVKGVSVTRIPSICQTLRGDLDADSPLYNVEIQLYG